MRAILTGITALLLGLGSAVYAQEPETRLVAIEPCAAYFNALTLRCADPERPGEGLVAAVRMQSGGELLFEFEAALDD